MDTINILTSIKDLFLDKDMRLITIGFFITLATVLISSIDKWKNKKEKKYKKSNSIAVILFFITFASAYLTFSKGVDAIVKQRTITASQVERDRKIDSQSNVIAKLDSATYEYSLLNAKLTAQNMSLIKNIQDFQSGADSYCYFTFGMRNNNTYHFILHTIGKNPMDNVIANVADLFDGDKNLMGLTINLGKIYPIKNGIQILDNLYAPSKKDSIYMNIFFQTNSRQFIQTLKEIKVNDKWISSIAIHEIYGTIDKIVFNKIDKNFPNKFP